MKKKLAELQEKRNVIWEQMKGINDKALAEKRDLTPDETTTWEKCDKDFQALTDEMKVVQDQLAARDSRTEKMGQYSQLMEKRDGNVVNGDAIWDRAEGRNEGAGRGSADPTASQEYRAAFRKYLVDPRILTADDYRALQADKDTIGGFLTTPQQVVMELIQALGNSVFVRRYGRAFSVPNAQSLGAPALDNDPADPTWTAEIKTGSEDSTMNFDKRELYPHPLAKRIKVSKKLVRVSQLDIDALIRDRFNYKFNVVEENSFLNGSGSNQPLGVFTASAMGINTDRDVSTGNTSGAVTADGLIECKYSLKEQYRASARWAFNRVAVKKIRKMKTGEGDYLWRPGIATDRPDTILDLPFDESEYVPSIFTTGLYVGILANWQFYWIADALDMSIQVLTELYAETNQNGYIARKETDGMPVLSEAFARVKLG